MSAATGGLPPGVPSPDGRSPDSLPPGSLPPAGDAASGRTLYGVQALRGLAALSVAWFHITGAAGFFAGHQGVPPYDWIARIPWAAGVDVFFVISGFVIVYASTGLFARPGAAKDFLARRIARMVPLYWAATALLIAVVALTGVHLNSTHADDPPYVAASFLFVPWPRSSDGADLPLLSIGWTLNYEMFFYALFACCLGLTRRRASLAAVLALAAVVAYGALLHPVQPQLQFWTNGVILEFGLGIGLANLRLDGARAPGWVRLAMLLGGAATLLLGSETHRFLTFGLSAALVVGAATLGEERLSARTRGFCAWAGALSYPLYLTHAFPMRGMREICERLPIRGDGRIVLYIVSTTVVSVAAAALAHRWIEVPAARMIRRHAQATLPGRPPGALAQSPAA